MATYKASNPFALLDDEPDVPEREVTESPATAATTQQPEKKVAVPVKLKPADIRKKNKAVVGMSARDDSNVSARMTSAGGSSNADVDAPVPNSHHEKRDNHTRPKRGGRGGWHGRGREFDRHSAGRKDSEKKVHQGWGDGTNPTDSEPVRDEDGNVVETPVVAAGVSSEGAGAEGEEVEAPIPEPKVKTLDEYLAEKAQITINLNPERKPRKANEGTDESQWSNAVQLERKVEDSEYVLRTANGEVTTAKSKKKQQKKTLDIDVRIANPNFGSREGGRGGRGSARGGRGWRGGRGGKTNNPSLNDTSAFPILAK